MNRLTAILIVGLVVTATLLGLVLNDKTDNQTNAHNGVTNRPAISQSELAVMNIEPGKVVISDYSFIPVKMTVKKGTTVTWTNQDKAHHDITPDKPSDIFRASKLLSKGDSYSVTFSQTGTYGYHCAPHPYMKGIVEVTE
jgi:plastocyanin